MFWGLSMEPQKRYSQTVTEPFHVSQAALDCSTLNNESGPTQLIIDFNENSYLLASLCKKDRIYQVPLDLNFERGDVISLRTVGPGVIHMSGYHIIEEDASDLARRLMGDDGEEVDDESEEDEDESTDESMVQTYKRKKRLALMGKSKKKKLDEASSDDEDDDEDDDADDSIDSTLGDSTLAALAEEDSDEEDDDDDDDVEEEEEEDDESDASELDSDEEVEQVPKKNNVVVNGTGTPKSAKKEKTKTPKSEKKSNNEQNQLNKTPKQDKTPRKEGKTPKGAETPKLDKGTPKPEKTPNAASPSKRVIEGGVIVEDLKQGNGPVAKEGKMLHMYYVGRLKSNNKQFDATTAGPGFKFRLGKGEVIKGWDVGIQGMKVGGKRRLTVPAPMAYGKQGSPPVIPSNATLTFDVELRRVS